MGQEGSWRQVFRQLEQGDTGRDYQLVIQAFTVVDITFGEVQGEEKIRAQPFQQKINIMRAEVS